MSEDNIEMIHIVLRFSTQKDIHIIGVYRPPTGNVKAALDKIREALDSFRITEETVLLGDFNIDWSHIANSATKALRDLVEDRSLNPFITAPTRVTPRSSSCIDLIFSNITYVNESGTINLNVSDHFPVFIVKKKQHTHRPFAEKWCRPLRNLNWDCFVEEIKSINTGSYFNSRDPSEIWDNFYGMIIQVLDRICPLKLVRFYTDNSTFLDDELRQLMRERDIAFRVARKRGSHVDWNRAKTLRSRVRSELIRSKRKFILRQLEAADGDGKKFWYTINSAFLKSSPPLIDRVFKQNSTTLVYGKEAADNINDYFCHVSALLSSKFGPISPCGANDNLFYDGPYLDRALLSVDMVIEQIKNIDVSKSSGFREVSALIIKRALLAVPKFFTDLLNLCLDESIFPHSWKCAIVVAIPKKGDPRQLGNIRPISLLPVTGKIREYFLNQEILDHMEGERLLADQQMGLRGGGPPWRAAFV